MVSLLLIAMKALYQLKIWCSIVKEIFGNIFTALSGYIIIKKAWSEEIMLRENWLKKIQKKYEKRLERNRIL